MKKIYLLSSLLITNFFYAQNKVDFSKLDRSGMKTSLLLTDVNLFSVLAQEKNSYDMYSFKQSYNELGNSDLQKRFKNSESINYEIREITNNETIKIGLLYSDFEIISKKAFDKGLLKIENNFVKRNSSDYVFDQYSNTIMSLLSHRKIGLETKFELDSKFFVNTTLNRIVNIKVDFDNGNGLTNLEFDKKITINYATEGKKEIKFIVSYENGTEKTIQSNLVVNYSNSDIKRLFRRAPTLITSTRIPDLGLYGETDLSPGKCEYEVFLSPDGILDKPIFLLDGFDPSDTRNIAAVYNLLNFTNSSGVTQNMGDKLRNENNFDVVIVNFPTYTNAANHVTDGGADYIERNALSFINVVELINAQKIGTEKNVIIGPSMGGLISRYALRYMETNSIDPKSRLWISFDSPHKGANVSIGLQHMFNYFAYGKANSDAIKPLVAGTLRSPAAKQMLIDHFDAHTTSIIGVNNPVVPTTGLPLVPTGCPNYRTNFQNRMNTLGFPQTTRNVAMTNGSGLGALFNSITNTPVTPGFDLINSTIDTGAVSGVNTRAVTFCEYMPNAGVNEQIVNVQIQAQIFFWITQDTFIATATQSANTNGVDSAPGGLFDIFGLTTGVAANPTLTNFLNAMRAGYFCFIPTISSMALTPPNYYAAINLGAGDTPWDATTTINPQTPFVNWYMAPTNETHVKLTAANVAFALTEIINPILSKPENTFSNLVIRNPLDNTIELYTQREISNCELTIFDVLGKVIYNKNNENLVGDYQIPFSATKGIYFLSIKNSEGKILKKLIKN